MNEYFLHFIWQYQYFNKHELKNNQGEALTVLHPGYRNTDQGSIGKPGGIVFSGINIS